MADECKRPVNYILITLKTLPKFAACVEPSDRAAAITACEQSVLNRAVWCRQNRIPYNRFMRWLKSQRKEEEQSSAFVQIKPSAPQPASCPIEIHIREGKGL